MVRAWDVAFTAAADEISSIRRDIASFESRILSIKGAEKESLYRARASVHVWLAAVIERFVVQWVDALCLEITQKNEKWCDVRLSLFPMACGSDIQALSSGLKKGVWKRKVSMFSLTSSAETARLEIAHAPLDGRTIRPSHLDDIWEVFGISGNPFPSPIHRILLDTIANNRNNVAHGVERPAVVGARLTYDDALRHALKVEDMLEHFVIASEQYISLSNYRR